MIAHDHDNPEEEDPAPLPGPGPLPPVEASPSGLAVVLDADRPALPAKKVGPTVSVEFAEEEVVRSRAAPPPTIVGPTSRSDQFIGRQFGGYRIEELLGAGGMGMVFKARQVSLDRVVALKLLNKALVDNEEFIKRFQREAKAMAVIHHPNIVAVIDFGHQDGIWFLVAEFVDGTNLARMIKEQLMIPAQTLAPLLIQCLGAFEHVSKSGIVHRDIKPDNILIDQSGAAKIADFGLAKDVTREETDLTAAGSAMGTPAYMSPEQCMGRKLDIRSDIYALGVTAYYALTGEKPFTGNSSFEIMTRHREYLPPAPHTINPRIPKDVSHLVMRMLAKNPNDRFPDAASAKAEWILLSQRLGWIGGITVSGEFYFPSDLPAPVAPAVARPAVSIPSLPGKPTSQPQAPAPEPPPAEPGRSGHSAEQPDPLPPMPANQPSARLQQGNPERIASESFHRRRSTSDRLVAVRHPAQLPAAAPEPSPAPVPARPSLATCPRCGSLVHDGDKACEHCSHILGPTASGIGADDPREAQRLLDFGNYEAAANMFARLAEQTSDRRLRASLRTHEREARSQVVGRQCEELMQRTRLLVDQGNLVGAIKTLEKAQTGSLPAGLSERIAAELALLQARRRRARRWRWPVVILVVLLLAAAGLHLAKGHLPAWFPRIPLITAGG